MPNISGIPNIREIVDDINRNISRIQDADGERVAEILKTLGQVVITNPRLEKEERRQTIESLQWLAREASLPPEDRHINALKGTLKYLPMLLDKNLNHLNYFNVHLQDLRKFFDID